MNRRTIFSIAMAAVFLAASGCGSPTIPRHPTDPPEDGTPKQPPSDARLMVTPAPVYA